MGSYVAGISRDRPGCILFLLDQSQSMGGPFAGDTSRSKAQALADAINKLLMDLVLRCTRNVNEGPRNYFDVGVIGYGDSWESGPGPCLGGALKGRALVSIRDLAENYLRLEERTRMAADGVGGLVETKVRFPVWFDPVAEDGTPMREALELAGDILRPWIAEHKRSYPPIVINISDGEPNDDPTAAARRLMALETDDGNVLLYNLHLSELAASPLLFPTASSRLPDDFAQMLFQMSSPLPSQIQNELRLEGYAVESGTRGFVFNSDAGALIQFLAIGTRLVLESTPQSYDQSRERTVVAGSWGQALGGSNRDNGNDGGVQSPGPRGGGSGIGPPGAPEGSAAGGGDSHARPRYLNGRCPESISVGKPFSLLASIGLTPGPAWAMTKSLDVPPEGLDVLIVAYAPELRLLSNERQRVHVPADTDSEPVMFELRADSPGPRSVSLTAWLDGNYLGELVVEITAERDAPTGPDREVRAEMTTEVSEGAVSLVVRYDKIQNSYRFEFRDEDNPAEVTSNLAYDPGPHVERLIAGLDRLAKGRSGYDPDQALDYLQQEGAKLWRDLVPEPLRVQFWDRQQRIKQLTILSDKDAVPWELLYPLDPGHDADFLVKQFPVTRAIFGRRLPRKLSLRPARFVIPNSLPEARLEIQTMQQLLDPSQPPSTVISTLTPLQDLIRSGDFGLLHFACHNRFDPTDGSSITLGSAQFTPTHLTRAAIGRVLARSAPTVFINACRSAGSNATYNRLDGWASNFLEAGAGAFIGSLWAVSDAAAREFAQELYHQLQAGYPLGRAVMQARQVAASQPDDPTWLAYTVYGDPRATVNQRL